MDTATIKRETLILSASVVFLLDPLLLELFNLVHTPKLLALGFTRLIQTLAVLAVVRFFQNDFACIGLAGKDNVPGIVKGAIWSLITAGITLVVFLGLSVSGVNPLKLIRTTLPGSTVQTVYYFIVGGLIAPVAEEIFFRGVLYRFLRPWGFAFALTVSTAVFASFHVLFSGQTFPVVQVAGGILFAVSFEKVKSLWAPVIIHASGNIAIFTLSLI